ncbi:T9SS type A sorting domain-containing protein [bacterium]|nr:T9SS type A sorting domain-containing protein [bacterium]
MKIRYILYLIFGFLFISSGVQAQTVVQSVISSDQNWKALAGPFIVTGNVLIDSGVTVTVDPGTHIRSEGNFRIIVEGEFIADGSSSNVITIDSVSFEFTKDAVGYDFGSGTGSFFEYVVFNGQSIGGAKQVDTKGPNLYISNCEFNTCYYCVYGSPSGYDTAIIRVEESVYNGDGMGYATYMTGNTFLTLDEVEVNNMGSMGLGKNATVTNSSFNNFGYYSGIRLSSTDNLVMNCNSFVNFKHYMIDAYTLRKDAHIEITNNTFDSAGILLNINSSYPLDFTYEYNNLGYYTENSVKCGTSPTVGSPTTLDLQNNYWGTTDTNEINAGIADYRTDITSRFFVDHSNALSSAVTDCDGGNISSIRNLNNINFNVYPNPANNQLNISGINSDFEVVILNTQGTEVYRSNFSRGSATINTTDFASGVYFIQVLSSNEGMAQQTFLVGH